MSQAVNPSELKPANRRGRASRRTGAYRDSSGLSPVAAVPVGPDARTGIAANGEMERLYLSLCGVTPENHPSTARLLAASTRKAAQKVIEEAGEVALEAVKHNAQAIVHESAICSTTSSRAAGPKNSGLQRNRLKRAIGRQTCPPQPQSGEEVTMTKANQFIGQARRTNATGAGRHAGSAYGAFGLVMQSAIGVVRESAGLVRNVAGLGVALVLDTKSAEPKRLPAPRPLSAPTATNVIRVPVTRNVGLRNQWE